LAGRLNDYHYQQYEAEVEMERQQFLRDNDLPTAESVGAVSAAEARRNVTGQDVWRMMHGPEAVQMGGPQGYREQGAFQAPGLEDPYSSFMQYFRQAYRPEMDLRGQVANNRYGRDNLFGSIARMDTMMGGG